MLARRLRRASGDWGETSLIRRRLNAQTQRAGCRRRSISRRTSASSLSSAGTSTSTVTSWSPRLPSFAVKPRPLSRSTLPDVVPLGIGQHHRSFGRRHLHLGAQHRFLERDRQLEPDIVPVAGEKAVRRDLDRDDRVAAPARALLALAGKADLGPVLEALGKLEVDRLAVGKRDPLRLQRHRVVERDLQPIGDVGALLRRPRALAKAAERPAARRRRAAAGLRRTGLRTGRSNRPRRRRRS